MKHLPKGSCVGSLFPVGAVWRGCGNLRVMVLLEKEGHWGSELVPDPVSSASYLPQGGQLWSCAPVTTAFSLMLVWESVVPRAKGSSSCGKKKNFLYLWSFLCYKKLTHFSFFLTLWNSYYMPVTCVTSLPRHSHPWIQNEIPTLPRHKLQWCLLKVFTGYLRESLNGISYICSWNNWPWPSFFSFLGILFLFLLLWSSISTTRSN